MRSTRQKWVEMLKSPSWLVAVPRCTAPEGDLSMTASRPSVTSRNSTLDEAVDGAQGNLSQGNLLLQHSRCSSSWSSRWSTGWSDDPADGCNSPYLGTRPSKTHQLTTTFNNCISPALVWEPIHNYQISTIKDQQSRSQTLRLLFTQSGHSSRAHQSAFDYQPQ